MTYHFLSTANARDTNFALIKINSWIFTSLRFTSVALGICMVRGEGGGHEYEWDHYSSKVDKNEGSNCVWEMGGGTRFDCLEYEKVDR